MVSPGTDTCAWCNSLFSVTVQHTPRLEIIIMDFAASCSKSLLTELHGD